VANGPLAIALNAGYLQVHPSVCALYFEIPLHSLKRQLQMLLTKFINGIHLFSLQDYDSGIIDPWFGWECDGTQLDHALVLVGYGQSTSDFGTTNYWVRTSSCIFIISSIDQGVTDCLLTDREEQLGN
jgi:hypothetical protein